MYLNHKLKRCVRRIRDPSFYNLLCRPVAKTFDMCITFQTTCN